MADLHEDELASAVFWTYVVNSITQHVMISNLTSTRISNKQIEQINIKIIEIQANQQKYNSIDLDKLMFHLDQPVASLIHLQVHHRLRQRQHLHRAGWNQKCNSLLKAGSGDRRLYTTTT